MSIISRTRNQLSMNAIKRIECVARRLDQVDVAAKDEEAGKVEGVRTKYVPFFDGSAHFKKLVAILV